MPIDAKPNREAEGRQNTTIRPKSLRRANIVLTHVAELKENVTDFISNSVDERAKALVRKHKIKLPADVAFAD